MKPKMVSPNELGRRLHLLRWGTWTLRQVEDQTGVAPSVVSRWERGVSYPDLRKLDTVATFYGVKVSELLDPDYDTRVWRKADPRSRVA